MWLPKWLGNLYSTLHCSQGLEAFTFEAVAELMPSSNAAKVAIAMLRKEGILYVHSIQARKRFYRVCAPEALPFLASGRLKHLDKIKQGRYGRLIGLMGVQILRSIRETRAILLFGSVARGTASNESDVDLLVIMKTSDSMGRRLDRLTELEMTEGVAMEIDWLSAHSIETHVSFLPLRPEEAEAFPPVLLDVVEDGIPIFDDGFYQGWLASKSRTLRSLGARRVPLGDGEWYWDLKPDIKMGEVYAF